MKNIIRKFICLISVILCFVVLGCDLNPEEHKHFYDNLWSFDETNHWHDALCVHSDQKSEIGNHEFGEWSEITAATETEEGSQEKTCLICGYKVTEKIEVLKHTHEIGTKHEAVAGTCTEKGTKEYYDCKKETCKAKLDKDAKELVSVEGTLDPNNHTGSTSWETTETTHKEVWDCCGVVKTEEEIENDSKKKIFAIKKIEDTLLISDWKSIAEYENNSNGKPDTITTTTDSGGIITITKTRYEYNENGDVIKLSISSNDTVTQKIEYEYDSDNYLVKEKSTSLISDWKTITEYENNSNGKPDTITTTTKSGEVTTVTTRRYEYNANGDISEVRFSSNDIDTMINEYEYDSDNYLVKEKSTSLISDWKTITEYENNSNGKPDTITTTTKSGEVTTVTTSRYEYNDNNDVIKYTVSSNDSETQIVEYEYEEIDL